MTPLGHLEMVTATVKGGCPLLCPALPTEGKCGCCSLPAWADPCSPWVPSGTAGILNPCCRNINKPCCRNIYYQPCQWSWFLSRLLWSPTCVMKCWFMPADNPANSIKLQFELCWIISFTAYKWNEIKSETFTIFLAVFFFGPGPRAAAPWNAIFTWIYSQRSKLSCRWSLARNKHHCRLHLQLPIPALCADSSQHPQRWETQAEFSSFSA